MPDRAATVSAPVKKASCNARLEGFRLAQAWSFSTSTSSSMSRIESGPSSRTRATTRRRSAGETPANQPPGASRRRRMAGTKNRKSRVGT
jgi:hypothetical protein